MPVMSLSPVTKIVSCKSALTDNRNVVGWSLAKETDFLQVSLSQHPKIQSVVIFFCYPNHINFYYLVSITDSRGNEILPTTSVHCKNIRLYNLFFEVFSKVIIHTVKSAEFFYSNTVPTVIVLTCYKLKL